MSCKSSLRELTLDLDGSVTLGPWLHALSCLTSLAVRAEPVEVLLGLERLTSLCRLDLSGSPGASVASLPAGLSTLGLCSCELRELPACLSSLTGLEVRDCSSHWPAHWQLSLWLAANRANRPACADAGAGCE